MLENVLPSRFILFAWLAAAVMLALFIEDVSRARRRATRLVAVGALAVTTASLWPLLHPPSTRVTAPRFFVTSDVRRIPEGATAIVAPTRASSIVPMVWQLKADFRFLMPQGPVFTPDGWGNANVPLFTVINVVERDLPRSLFPIPDVCREIPASFSNGCLALARGPRLPRPVKGQAQGVLGGRIVYAGGFAFDTTGYTRPPASATRDEVNRARSPRTIRYSRETWLFDPAAL